MKKAIALILALVLVLTAAAVLAEGASKTGGDNNNATVVPVAGDAKTDDFFFKVSEEADDVERANAVLALLKEAASVQDFFGQADEIAAILGEPDYAVNEFWPVIAGNYEDTMGDLLVKMSFATPYEKDQDVAVELGFVTGADDEGKPVTSWKTYAGKGEEDGSISFTLDGATIKEVVETGALLAVVSK